MKKSTDIFLVVTSLVLVGWTVQCTEEAAHSDDDDDVSGDADGDSDGDSDSDADSDGDGDTDSDGDGDADSDGDADGDADGDGDSDSDSDTDSDCTQDFDITQTVSDGAQTYTLMMVKESLRGPNFNVKIQNDSGGYDDYSPGDVQTYVGQVDELPDALVGGYMQPDGQLYARILLDRGIEWISLGDSIIHKDNEAQPDYQFPTEPSVESDMAGTEVYQYELGIDLDFAGYQNMGGDPAEALEMIEKNMIHFKAIQLRDTMLIPTLGRIVIRASESQDPYQGITETALMGPFSEEWRENQADALEYCFKVQLASANIGGGVAAYPGTFSVASVWDSGWFMLAGRHELGHNFHVDDYDAGSPEGRTIMCGNQFSRFCGPGVRDTMSNRDQNIGDKLVSIGGPYTTVDVPPYAALDHPVIEYMQGTSEEHLIDVLANDFSATASELTLVSTDSTSNQGGALKISQGTGPDGRDEVSYTNPSGATGLDWFHYVIEDSCGKIATGVVTVNLESRSHL